MYGYKNNTVMYRPAITTKKLVHYRVIKSLHITAKIKMLNFLQVSPCLFLWPLPINQCNRDQGTGSTRFTVEFAAKL